MYDYSLHTNYLFLGKLFLMPDIYSCSRQVKLFFYLPVDKANVHLLSVDLHHRHINNYCESVNYLNAQIHRAPSITSKLCKKLTVGFKHINGHFL